MSSGSYMKRIDKIIAAIIISILFIFSSHYLFVWCGKLLSLNINAMALTGLTVSVLFCLIWLKNILNNLYTLSWWYFIIFYLISSFVIFIQMKTLIIPLLIFALIAGVYTGRRVGYAGGTEFELYKILRKTALFSELVLVIYLTISAIIILSSAETVKSIHFLHYLSFEISNTVLWVLGILIGSIVLLLNYFIVIWIGRSVYSIKSEKDNLPIS
jgi:hypothetical protein